MRIVFYLLPCFEKQFNGRRHRSIEIYAAVLYNCVSYVHEKIDDSPLSIFQEDRRARISKLVHYQKEDKPNSSRMIHESDGSFSLAGTQMIFDGVRIAKLDQSLIIKQLLGEITSARSHPLGLRRNSAENTNIRFLLDYRNRYICYNLVASLIEFEKTTAR